MPMIIALYVKSHRSPDFLFRVAKVVPEGYSFDEYKNYLIRTFGSPRAQSNKVLPANTLSSLPDVLENLNVN